MESANAVNILELHEQSKIKYVELAQLHIDPSYQRKPSQAWGSEIGSDFDEISAELILVSDRGDRNGDDVEGGMWVVSGQHRVIGATKAARKRIQARVIDTSMIDDPGKIESSLRLRTNRRLADKSNERFRAQVRQGNPESVAILSLLESFDTEINERPQPETGINAVASLEKAYRIDGTGQALRETLQVIKDAYGYVGGKNASAAMIGGVSWFIIQHGVEAERSRFVEKLSSTGMAALKNRAVTTQSAMGGTLWLNFYRAMVEFFNDRLQDKSRLEWKTRGASKFVGGQQD